MVGLTFLGTAAVVFEDLGGLKGNKGMQQYDVPAGLDRYATVVIWCRAFTIAFGKADLERS